MKKIIKLNPEDKKCVYSTLKKGKPLTISGVGKLTVRKDKKVKIYNPFHKKYEVRDKTYISFKPSDSLKNQIK